MLASYESSAEHRAGIMTEWFTFTVEIGISPRLARMPGSI